jgi:flagellar protein FliO/FliZ
MLAIHRRWLPSAGLLLISLSAFAQSEKPFAAPEQTAQVVQTAGSLGQVTLSLLLVLAAVFAAAFMVRRLRGLGKFGSQAITVIADLGLGPKERAVLVQVGSQQLLLGVAPGRVSVLHVLDEPVSVVAAVVAASQQEADASVPAVADFKAVLKRSLGLK